MVILNSTVHWPWCFFLQTLFPYFSLPLTPCGFECECIHVFFHVCVCVHACVCSSVRMWVLRSIKHVHFQAQTTVFQSVCTRNLGFLLPQMLLFSLTSWPASYWDPFLVLRYVWLSITPIKEHNFLINRSWRDWKKAFSSCRSRGKWSCRKSTLSKSCSITFRSLWWGRRPDWGEEVEPRGIPWTWG